MQYVKHGRHDMNAGIQFYSQAARRRTVRLNQMAGELGWTNEEIESEASRLDSLGLLHEVAGAPGTYLLVDPAIALDRLTAPLSAQIQHCQERAEGIRSELAGFAEVYAEAMQEVQSTEGFRLLRGMDLINAEVTRAAEACTQEALTAQPGGGRSTESLEAAWPSTRAMLSRQVQMHTLYHHAARFSPPTCEYVRQAQQYGAEVRTSASFFQRVVIFDREVAFIPSGGDRQEAVMVRQPAVVRFLVGVFESAWLNAQPFPTENRKADLGDVMSSVRLAIVRMLAEGETDEVIARRVGLSVRTCRAHIAKVYEQLGARSRCHLGVLLERSGILETQTPESATPG